MKQEGQPDSEVVFVVEPASEGGLVARAVGVSIFTEADSLEHLREAVREAVACHFGDASTPSVIRLRFEWEETLRM